MYGLICYLSCSLTGAVIVVEVSDSFLWTANFAASEYIGVLKVLGSNHVPLVFLNELKKRAVDRWICVYRGR
jgi:hypothetical protein